MKEQSAIVDWSAMLIPSPGRHTLMRDCAPGLLQYETSAPPDVVSGTVSANDGNCAMPSGGRAHRLCSAIEAAAMTTRAGTGVRCPFSHRPRTDVAMPLMQVS